MSLSKQLLILISLIFLMVFTVSFYISINNIRNYLQVESQVHVQDTATSLGLSLSPHMDDELDPILETMMNAIFDMGYYKEMRLENVDGEDLVKLNNPVRMEGVPRWIIKLLPLKTATARSEISSGWNISGTLYVSSNPAYAYLKLYEQAKETLLYSGMLFIGAFILVLLVLRLTLQPLKAIQKQANEISGGNFTTIGKLPWTTEVRQVAKSMNGMSQKIGNTISSLNNRLDALNDSLKRDSLTNLFNQATFNVDIKAALAAGISGYALYIKFDDLGKITKQLGNLKVDKLLQSFSALLQNAVGDKGNAYRLYGSEFALITHTDDVNSITALAEQLKQDINNLGKEYKVDDMVHSGIVLFNKTSEFDRLMPALMEAYEQARLVGHNAYAIQQESISSMDELAWKDAVQDAITNNTPEITFTAEAYNYNVTPPEQVMQEAFTAVRDKEGKILSIGTFFSVAQEFGLAEDLDKTIINKVISTIETDSITSPVTINLSMASVASRAFQRWLESRLEQSAVPNEQLAFSVTAYAAAKDIVTFDAFSDFIESLGATMLLKRYSPDIIPVDKLHDLHIDYIRLARDLTTDIASNSSKSDFLGLIQEVANLMEIKVLAESVTEDADFAIVKRAGLFGISR